MIKRFLRRYWDYEWHYKWKRIGLHVDSTRREVNRGRVIWYAMFLGLVAQYFAYNKIIKDLTDPDFDPGDFDPRTAPELFQDLINEWRESLPHHIAVFGLASAQEYFGLDVVDEYFRDLRSQEQHTNATREG